MLLRQLIEESNRTFSETGSFIAFYRSYFLAVMYSKYKLNKPITINISLDALKVYYWNSLAKAHLIIKKEKEESYSAFNERIKNVYYTYRQNAYNLITSRTKEEQKTIYKILRVATELETKELKKRVDTPLILLGKDYDETTI